MRKIVALLFAIACATGLAFGLKHLRDQNHRHTFVARETALVLRIAAPRALGLHMPCNLDDADELTLWVVRAPEPSWLTEIRGVPEASLACARNALRQGGHTAETTAAAETFRRTDGSAARIEHGALWMGDGNALDRVTESRDSSSPLATCVSGNPNGACIDARALDGPEGIVEAQIESLTSERIALRATASNEESLTAAQAAFATVGVLDVGDIHAGVFTVTAPTESLRALFTSGW